MFAEQYTQPSAENNYCGEHAELLLSSFYRLTNKQLIDPSLSQVERYRLLNEAPFCVVSHDTAEVPVFNYGNKIALHMFELSWPEFTQLESRKSAEPSVQSERERLLNRVAEYGFIDDYKGVRISSTGQRFFVEKAIVWNLVDGLGVFRGQAAVLYEWTVL